MYMWEEAMMPVHRGFFMTCGDISSWQPHHYGELKRYRRCSPTHWKLLKRLYIEITPEQKAREPTSFLLEADSPAWDYSCKKRFTDTAESMWYYEHRINDTVILEKKRIQIRMSRQKPNQIKNQAHIILRLPTKTYQSNEPWKLNIIQNGNTRVIRIEWSL